MYLDLAWFFLKPSLLSNWDAIFLGWYGVVLLNLESLRCHQSIIKSSLSHLHTSRTYYSKSKELENLQGYDYLDLNWLQFFLVFFDRLTAPTNMNMMVQFQRKGIRAQGRSQDLELRGATLLLTVCGGSKLWLYCFTSKDFCLKFFKWSSFLS